MLYGNKCISDLQPTISKQKEKNHYLEMNLLVDIVKTLGICFQIQ